MAKQDRLQQIAISAIRDPSDDGVKEIIQGAETEPDGASSFIAWKFSVAKATLESQMFIS